MASRNLYLTYKKDTSRLLYWVINTSNAIIKSGTNTDEDALVAMNTTGQVTVAEIVSMSKFIAKYLKPLPSTVFELFGAVVQARSTMHAVFTKIVSEKPDPEIERSNATHKHFIDALTEALEALSGAHRNSKDDPLDMAEADSKDVFLNRFSILSLDHAQDEDDDASSAERAQPTLEKTQKKSNGKGKKGKNAKRCKKSKQKSSSESTAEPFMSDIPVENYRIIEDKDGLDSEYLLTVYAVIQEWMELRNITQDLWREVAYDDLNGAVAASLTSTAVAMVKQTCIAVFADFPDHESYNTIIRTVTRGDPEEAQAGFSLFIHCIPDGRHTPEQVQVRDIDAKEQFWIHAYNDLVAFITDFQKIELANPPKICKHISTIGTQSLMSSALQMRSVSLGVHNKIEIEHHVYEDIDWSRIGPWDQYRRLFGLTEFAGEITTLARQKSNTDVLGKIPPHHVFQLQCVVDSFTASRGWTLSPLRGHVLTPAPRKFRPRRDVDFFLDREDQIGDQRLIQSFVLLTGMLQKDAELHGDPTRHTARFQLLKDLEFDFSHWLGDSRLGESKYMHSLTTTPSSRFSKHHANRLWEFSPLLCAAGLVEGLVLVQRVMMKIWDNIPEPTLILHLHNNLVQKRYLKKEVGLFATLGRLFEDYCFPTVVPTDKFRNALETCTFKTLFNCASKLQRAIVSKDKTKGVHQLFDPSLNRLFKVKSTLMTYYYVGWMPEHIPDSAVKIPSALYTVRLMYTERITDPVTKKKSLKETELVKRAKARGMTDDRILKMASIALPVFTTKAPDTDKLMRSTTDFQDYDPGPARDPYQVSKQKDPGQIQGSHLLDFLRLDVFADVCGRHPLSGLNLVMITGCIILLIIKIEERFREARHSLWILVYEGPGSQPTHQKRVTLALAAMRNQDDRAMKLFAEVFEECRSDTPPFFFWEIQREMEAGMRKEYDEDEVPKDQ